MSFFNGENMDNKLKLNEIGQANSTLTVKAKTLPDGQFEAIISTDDLDRHGERVSIKGMQIPKDQVIKMYYNHITWGEALPIGKWLRMWKSGNKLMGVGEIDQEDEFAVKVYKKIKAGYIDTISVSFYPQEYDTETDTWTKSTLVEASVVAEPANVNAKITNKELKSELGFTEDEFEAEGKAKLTHGTTEELTQDGEGETEELKSVIEQLKSKVGALEDAMKAANDSQSVKSLIKVRMAGKAVDKTAETVNRIIKIQLKG